MLMPLLQTTGVTIDLAKQAEAQNLAGSQYSNFGEFLSQILTLVLVIAGLLLLLYLVWGAINWMSSGGESSKVQKARDQITQAVIGLVVLLSSLAIFNLLQNFFGFEVLNFSTSRNGRATQVNSQQQLLENAQEAAEAAQGNQGELLDARRVLEDRLTGPQAPINNDTTINQL